MFTIVPIAFQISEEQKQVISKIAASVAPILGPCDCVLLTLILRKDGATRGLLDLRSGVPLVWHLLP
jgi:hypothetical protein